ncbi:MAG TPA: hypothetical protein EYP31_07800 [Roseibacterium sp.]|nr:hypothetical protein [Roseibacterium sp.]
MLRAFALGLLVATSAATTSAATSGAATSGAAQDPSQATLTLGDETLFLYADNTASAVPMIWRDGDLLHLTFAELYLGFPLPPFLRVTLREGPAGWQALELTLERTQDDGDITTRSLQVISVEHAETGRIVMTGEALGYVSGGARPVAIHLELAITFPDP